MRKFLFALACVLLVEGKAFAGCSWHAEDDSSLRIEWSDSHVVMGYRGRVILDDSHSFPIEIICSNGYMTCYWSSSPSQGIKYEGNIVDLGAKGDPRFVLAYLGRVGWYEFDQKLRGRRGMFMALDGFWRKGKDCNADGWFE